MKFDFSALHQAVYPMKVGLDSICSVDTEGSRRTFQKEIRQNRYLLCLTIHGEGEILSDEVRVNVPENTFALLCPQKSCSYRCVDDAWKFWWVEFYSAEIMPELARTQPIADPEGFFKILEWCLETVKREEGKAAGGILAAFLALLFEAGDCQQKGGKLPARAARYVLENLNTVTVAGLCTYLDVSDRTLRNLFHRWFDMSPKRYILKCRMELACQLLGETTFSVGEVATQLGFANPFHFSGSFKGYYGISPSEYRKRA